MPKTKERKKEIIEGLKKLADKQKVTVFVGISGLNSEELFGLRRELKKNEAILKVAKKTLAQIALKDKRIRFPKEEIKEPMGFVFGFKDEILPIKILYQFQKEHENLKIFGGFLEGEFLEREKIIELAKLSSRDELLAKFVGTLSSLMQKFVYVLDYNFKGLVVVLKNIQNSK